MVNQGVPNQEALLEWVKHDAAILTQPRHYHDGKKLRNKPLLG